MTKFGAMIYNGQSISPEGIEKAMDWSGIPTEDYSYTAEKIVLYYKILNSKATVQVKKDTNNGSQKNTDRPPSKR